MAEHVTGTIRLGSMDAAFLLAETRTMPLHVAGLQIYKIPRGARAHFTTKLHATLRSIPVTAEPFTYRLARGAAGTFLPSWEIRDDVDLDYHLRLLALPRPGDEHELDRLVSRLHSVPMDLSRPPWEFCLIDGLAGDRFAVYVKLHHALVDGMNAVRLMAASKDGPHGLARPVWAAAPDGAMEHRRENRGLLERVTARLRDEIEAWPSLAGGFATTVQAARHATRDPDLAAVTDAPRTMFNARIGGERQLVTYRTRLSRIKAIGRAARGTVNDVVLAACSGALRRYLESVDQLPDRSLIAAMPVALAHDERDAAGNAVGSVLVRLGTDEPDVRRRFESIQRSSLAGKAYLKRMTRTAAMRFTMIAASPVLLEAWLPGVLNLAPPLFNVLVSNVPGPREKLHFHGAELQSWIPVSQVGQGQALNITVLSYASELAFGFVACPDCVPGVERLAPCLDEAIEELERTFAKQRARADHGKSLPA